jgi:cell division protein FtsQ
VTIIDSKADPSREPKGGEKPRRRWEKPAAIAIGVFLLMLAPFWAPLFFRRLAFFRLRHVEVIGARYIEPRDILDRLKVDTLASVWDPTARLESRVASHPLVREVRIGRRLPGTLVVRVVEHAPVALVATAGGFKAYDERGVALPIDPTTADVDAPILARPDSALLRLLAAARLTQPALYRRLSEVRRERAGPGDNELLFVLDSIPVRTLGDVTLNRLAEVELVEQDLARRRLRATELDLRYRDQVIARLNEP